MRLCPTCHSDLYEVERMNIMVDICLRCHGIWLDKGELEKIAHHIREMIGKTEKNNSGLQEEVGATREVEWLDDESLAVGVLISELEEDEQRVLSQVWRIRCGSKTLCFLIERANTLLATSDIAWLLKEPHTDMENALRVMVELGLARRLNVAGITLYGFTADPARQHLAHKLAAWRECWRTRLMRIEQVVNGNSTHANASTTI